MATVIRPELSKKNKYWIEKHRYYELKHFCLQYPIWKRKYSELGFLGGRSIDITGACGSTFNSNPTSRIAEKRLLYSDRIKLIERVAEETDPYIQEYIIKAVTEELSYNALKSKYDIPCSKDTYYDRYRRFFWLLNKAKH